ncbi:hypothetical protein ZEAMMB73_Zm00001d034216 [Zea mays]|uniref:Uncharacterized protein n=1 Tax=Zea mays TaxID=4577 RepID=A0A1D6L680_MAIZE|nr:hypothetical protein ZEAMMB73_Zm00001d034216 [Zea mays]
MSLATAVADLSWGWRTGVAKKAFSVKRFMREDWRLPPMTPEMIEYARTDAHYLLYIANCLASELHAKACGMF